MSLSQSTSRAGFHTFRPGPSSNLDDSRPYGFAVSDGHDADALVNRVGAEEVATEILLLSLIYNHYVFSGSHEELARFWDTEGICDLGLKFDVQGKIHADTEKLKQAYYRNSEKLNRFMTALWGVVEVNLMGCQNDPL